MSAFFIFLLCFYQISGAVLTKKDIHHEFGCSQLVVVTTAGWNQTSGKLTAYNWVGGAWKQAIGPVNIVTGWSGLAWGKGLHNNALNRGKVKTEGDGNSPAGIFPLAELFSYDEVKETRLKFVRVTTRNVCVDDPASGYYNQIIAADTVKKDWKSAENMRLQNDQYKYGIVVGHNMQPVIPAAGSCIFLHIWNNRETPTSGCTAMTEANMLKLISFLDRSKNPLLVQVPVQEYGRLKIRYTLP